MKDTSDGPLRRGGGSFKHDNTLAPKQEKIFPLMNNRGKTAIVTGAGAGIGLAVAQGFAESGANVAIWYHGNRKALDRAREIGEEYGVKCRAYQVDVTDQKQVSEVVDQIVREFNGRLDIFVANAGIPWTQGTFLDGDVAHYRKVMATDMDSTYYCAYAAGQHWRRQKQEGTDIFGDKLENFRGGSFIATASMSAHIVNIPQLQAAYNGAKAAVIHFVKSIAVEMVEFARANTVSPGYMATEISDFVPPETKDIWRDKIPMGREGEAHELKGAYLYLASDISSYVTGTDIIVDGGDEIQPWYDGYYGGASRISRQAHVNSHFSVRARSTLPSEAAFALSSFVNESDSDFVPHPSRSSWSASLSVDPRAISVTLLDPAPSLSSRPGMTTVDFRGPASYQQIPQLQHPHRKPVPSTAPSRSNDLRPLSKIVPDIDYSGQQQQNASSYATYSRKGPQPPNTTSPASQYPVPITKSRRTPSQSTTSTAVSGYAPTRTPSSVSSALSRNASTRSGASTTPGSYVALMRKQKATVWCDRAQHEDPRLAAQHKAAKIRATREITGKVPEGRTSTSGSMGSGSLGVRSKIRHHGLPKATGYSYANMVGGGVPMRLSASEVGDEGSHYDDAERKMSMNNQRTNTGRNSSDNRWLDVDQKHRNRYSQGSTVQGESPNENIPELEETPVAGEEQQQQQQRRDYFPQHTGRASGSSSEHENSFGNIGQMQAPKTEEKVRKTSDELRRRGSVDERTNTMGYMGQGRLFVANPDLSD